MHNVGLPGPQPCDILSDLGVKQIACAERSLLILTDTGKVYSMYYSSEAQVSSFTFVLFKVFKSIGCLYFSVLT